MITSPAQLKLSRLTRSITVNVLAVVTSFAASFAVAAPMCESLFQSSPKRPLFSAVLRNGINGLKEKFNSRTRDTSQLGVGINMPQLTVDEMISNSGNYDYGITASRLPELSTLIRNEASIARKEDRALKLAEVSFGVPLTALELVDVGTFRRRGDMLNAIPENTPDDPTQMATGKFLLSQDSYSVKVHVFAPTGPTKTILENPSSYQGFVHHLFESVQRFIPNPNVLWGNWRRLETANAIQGAIDKAVETGSLFWRSGKLLNELKASVASGEKFDVLIAHEIAREPNRLGAIELIQKSLTPEGRALIPLTWWRTPEEGQPASRFRLCNDTVLTKEEGELPLETYLASRFPDGFELRESVGGITVLIVKGTSRLLRFSRFSARPNGNFNPTGSPTIQWTLEK